MRAELEQILELIIRNAFYLSTVFESSTDLLTRQRVKEMRKFIIISEVTLLRLQYGLLEGKERALFESFIPTSIYLNKQCKYYKI